ncbi:polysaccharide lyase [Halomarina ordinaria]|uniref:Polysaccharide lyase n=1 Tax=Halomarina ordinaria TaxID=3033939 RepID=A0ABD5U6B4_9EURY|nr:hypothetical protein [Halomarina sp. PSRA2]
MSRDTRRTDDTIHDAELSRRSYLAVGGGALAAFFEVFGDDWVGRVEAAEDEEDAAENTTDVEPEGAENETTEEDEGEPVSEEPADADLVVPFDGSGYADSFTETYRTDSNAIVDDGDASGGSALRVTLQQGSHYGTDMRYRFADEQGSEPTAIRVSYDVLVEEGFEATGDGGKLPGPAGTYDSAGWGGRPATGSDGWSARMSFYPTGDASAPIDLSYYTYHADMSGQYGDWMAWDEGGSTARLQAGTWHRIEQYVELNTPGQNDGVLRGWVDGDLAFERTDLRFRDTEDIAVEDYWFNVYHGGGETAPSDSSIRFDDLRITVESE